jgi:hypothetical protein
MRAALKHYERFGFKIGVYGDAGNLFDGFLSRGAIEMHATLVPNFDRQTNTTAVYLKVDDPDGLYAEWSQAGVAGQLVAPEDKPWGMREMSHVDLDGNLLRIGRDLE